MFLRILPSILYQSLPYCYLVAGALVLVFIRNWMAMASGLLLIAVGGLVLVMRWGHRRASQAKRKRGKHLQAPVALDPVVPDAHPLSWRSSYDCGESLIDQQHRELVGRASELVTALQAGCSHADVELLLEDFVDQVAMHFRAEESLAEAAGHPGLPEHRESHRVLLDRARDIAERFHGGQRVHNEMVRFITADLIERHVLGDDAAFTARA
jgi:hemerythrin-like metal-binding protein